MAERGCTVHCSLTRLDVLEDGLDEPLGRRAVQHAQDGGVRLGGEELEDGEHAPGGDLVAVEEAQGVGDRVPHAPGGKCHGGWMFGELLTEAWVARAVSWAQVNE